MIWQSARSAAFRLQRNVLFNYAASAIETLQPASFQTSYAKFRAKPLASKHDDPAFAAMTYDLETDLGERNDLFATHPDIVAEPHDKLLRHVAETIIEFEANSRKNPMNIILEREGQGNNH